jgi:hypothetical protein
MKKLLLTFGLIVATLLTFGQTTHYMRAKTFELGRKGVDKEVVWDKSSVSECDILIKFVSNQITIYSKTIQQYQVINYDGKMSNGANRWYCSDSNGKTCNVYLLQSDENPGYPSLIVEFDDLVWFYICKIVE